MFVQKSRFDVQKPLEYFNTPITQTSKLAVLLWLRFKTNAPLPFAPSLDAKLDKCFPLPHKTIIRKNNSQGCKIYQVSVIPLPYSPHYPIKTTQFFLSPYVKLLVGKKCPHFLFVSPLLWNFLGKKSTAYPGVPLVYTLDKNLKPIPHPDAISPLSARYLGDVSGIRARIEAVKAQTQSK